MKRKSSPRAGRKKRGGAAASKPYWEMTTAELREATSEFDREFIGDAFGPPAPEQRAQFEKAKRRRGRPQIGLGSKTISVTVEKRLLAQADRLAKKCHLPRAALVARGLQAVVAEEVPL